jgi:hypothetical protein
LRAVFPGVSLPAQAGTPAGEDAADLLAAPSPEIRSACDQQLVPIVMNAEWIMNVVQGAAHLRPSKHMPFPQSQTCIAWLAAGPQPQAPIAHVFGKSRTTARNNAIE